MAQASPDTGVWKQASSEVPELRGEAPRSSPAGYGPEDFPGCESFHLPAGALERYEGRLEFWDGETETAWKVCEPTTIEHEAPTRRLAQMATRVVALRGSPIACFGSSDLVRVDASGRKRWLMQADEVLYLHPDRVRLRGSAIDVDRDPLPDVVLEVDHTTDVRRRKLGIYMESGFPEIWVLVPWDSSRRTPGLAIHVRRGDGYREEARSQAFPGWGAEEIHLALTESPMSAGARRALERVALGMGEREGTRPEDDPFTRTISRKAQARGRAEGREEGRMEGQVRMMHRMAARKFGPETADRLVERLEGLGDSERVAAVGDWLIECESAEALLVRMERLRASSPSGGRASS